MPKRFFNWISGKAKAHDIDCKYIAGAKCQLDCWNHRLLREIVQPIHSRQVNNEDRDDHSEHEKYSDAFLSKIHGKYAFETTGSHICRLLEHADMASTARTSSN